MVQELRLLSSPPAQRFSTRLSRLGILLLLMVVGQGCGYIQSRRAFHRGLEAVKNQNYDLAIIEFSKAIRLKPDAAYILWVQSRQLRPQGRL